MALHWAVHNTQRGERAQGSGKSCSLRGFTRGGPRAPRTPSLEPPLANKKVKRESDSACKVQVYN